MSITLAFALPHIGFTGILMVALLVYALVKFLRRPPSFPIELEYTEEEKESFQNAAEEAFGSEPTVFHEKVSPDIHIDILLFPPNEHCPFFTACTMGVGAHRMNVPPQELQEQAKEHPVLNALIFPGWDRTELMMYLPADWKPAWLTMGASEEEINRSFLPLQTLKDAARYMVGVNTWYAFSQTFSYGEPFRPDSDYFAMIFASPLPDCRTPGFTLKAGDKDVSVLQMIPLTKAEYEAAKTDHAYEWLCNFLPIGSEEMQSFLQERLMK